MPLLRAVFLAMGVIALRSNCHSGVMVPTG